MCRAVGALARELPADQRDRYQSGVVDLLEVALQRERVAELLRARLHQLLEQVLAGDVARAVAGLAEIQLLLEAEQIQVRTHPAARRPLDLERLRVLDRVLVRLRAQRGET